EDRRAVGAGAELGDRQQIGRAAGRREQRRHGLVDRSHADSIPEWGYFAASSTSTVAARSSLVSLSSTAWCLPRAASLAASASRASPVWLDSTARSAWTGRLRPSSEMLSIVRCACAGTDVSASAWPSGSWRITPYPAAPARAVKITSERMASYSASKEPLSDPV